MLLRSMLFDEVKLIRAKYGVFVVSFSIATISL